MVSNENKNVYLLKLKTIVYAIIIIIIKKIIFLSSGPLMSLDAENSPDKIENKITINQNNKFCEYSI